MPKRRLNGEGTYGRKNIKGVKYEYYRDVNGRYTYAKTIKELKQKLKDKKEAEGLESIGNSNLIEKQITSTTTFGKFMNIWLLTKTKSISGSTYDCYEGMIDKQLVHFKKYRLSDKAIGVLKTNMFQNYFNALSEEYSKATINKMYSIIKQAVVYGEINYGIKPRLLDLVEIPKEEHVKIKKKIIPFLNLDDLKKLDIESQRVNELNNVINKAKKIGERVYGNNADAVVLIGYTGLRVSELCSLRWEDYNREDNTITVNESVSIIKNRNKKNDKENNYIRVQKEAKTKSSNRTIPLTDRAKEIIEEFSSKFPNHKDRDFICLTENANQMSRWNITRTLKGMIKRAGCSVDDVNVHALRHAYGYCMLTDKEHPCDIKIVSYLLGHKDISTTYNIYIGVADEQKKEAINIFNN